MGIVESNNKNLTLYCGSLPIDDVGDALGPIGDGVSFSGSAAAYEIHIPVVEGSTILSVNLTLNSASGSVTGAKVTNAEVDGEDATINFTTTDEAGVSATSDANISVYYMIAVNTPLVE